MREPGRSHTGCDDARDMPKNHSWGNTMSAAQQQQEVIVVTKDDLPLSCPRPEDEVWNMHPRVYLPIEKEKRCECPYCGAVYELRD